MKYQLNMNFFYVIVIAVTLIGCGGGGSGGVGGATISIIPDETPSSPPSPSPSGSVTLTWDAPTTNEDGSPLDDLAGYKVYYGTSSGNYSISATIGNFETATISNLSSNTWYFVITAYDSSGNESVYSEEVFTTI